MKFQKYQLGDSGSANIQNTESVYATFGGTCVTFFHPTSVEYILKPLGML